MKRANRVLLEKLKQRILPPPPQPEPDKTGWSGMDHVTWEAQQGRLVDLICQLAEEGAAADAARRLEEAKRAPRPPQEGEGAPEDVPPAAVSTPARATPSAGPTPSPPPIPDQPAERPLWREESVRWRLRGPQDHYWDDDLASAARRGEYDVLGDDDDD
jgi:hypothetical protein